MRTRIALINSLLPGWFLTFVVIGLASRPPIAVGQSKPKSASSSTTDSSKSSSPIAATQDPSPKETLERIEYADETKTVRRVDGRILVEAVDGGLLVLERDGRLTTIEKEQLRSREPTGEAFRAYSPQEVGAKLREELGAGFQVVTTRHYVLCGDAPKGYLTWCGALFERLHVAFHNFWKTRGFALAEPDLPLIAIVFSNRNLYAKFASDDAGPDIAASPGYFSIPRNRMVLYDLATGGLGPRETSVGGSSEVDYARRLAAAPFNVATIIHEATHQIAFNTGMHTRYADNPLWLTEGMAMFFETPDLTSRTGWKTVGAFNDLRAKHFREYLKRRPADSLETLLRGDARFTDGTAEETGDAYAEAWALTYFLIRTRKDDYVRYLREVSKKPRLKWDSAQERLEFFKTTFGPDLKKLDAELIRYLRRSSN